MVFEQGSRALLLTRVIAGAAAAAGANAAGGAWPLRPLATPWWAGCRAYSSASAPPSPVLHNPRGVPAFAFDIDGVLIRGRDVLPPALQAMQLLCRGGRWRYPVVFLTNGGGVTEARKAQELSAWLDVVLSHTPFRALVPRLRTRPVLVVGRRDTPAVAASYGFQKVLTTHDLAAAHPDALPFGAAAPPSGWKQRPAAAPCPVRDLGWGSDAAPIAAALVFCDPAGDSWYQDLQLLADVATSHGVPMRSRPAPGSSPTEFHFSNPDLLWANEHPRPRFGQGAFAAALSALHERLAGGPLPAAKFYGKPNPEPYRLCERLLLQQAAALGLAPAEAADAGSTGEASDCGSSAAAARVFSGGIYAVGDNPAADVRGANSAGPPWVSVLVRTGVFQGPGANSASDPAHVVVHDALAAVQAALHGAPASKSRAA
ncbi:hypothetical protein Rsub_12397 [Raphidocelis subcapitata]|uniref:Uncharacterized protein n=1 Tax=Raphidocelis subcapitata TaxID=307507 RepID=A0A2V0PJQ1_9CHLO|nr:hypothetical protein Rsub_12397 [Raphidocelis subcapitata]|eukprot:GBF99769.1 hypothetical protein Rsub_12397 [Raphidocelis subcapitata]